MHKAKVIKVRAVVKAHLAVAVAVAKVKGGQREGNPLKIKSSEEKVLQRKLMMIPIVLLGRAAAKN